MSRFMMGVTNLVKEECRTVILHDDMTLARLIVYAQSIEVSKLKMMSRIQKGVVLVIMVNLGLRRGLKLKKNPGVLIRNWRKEVVLKMEDLYVSLVEKGIMASV